MKLAVPDLISNSYFPAVAAVELGHFAAQGLDVELVYTRGGNAAMQALVGGAVEYAGTSFDVALQAAANGAAIRRFASTGRLPLFALAVAPARSRQIDTVARLTGATVAVSALGNADHALLLFLLIVSFRSRSVVFCQYLETMTGISLKPSDVRRVFAERGRNGVREMFLDLLIREDLKEGPIEIPGEEREEKHDESLVS